MSSGFKDSFTKEDNKEDVLGYDDTAFHYFAISVLSCVAVPWTISMVQSVVFGRSQEEYPVRSTEGKKFHHPKTAAMVSKMEHARREARICTPGRSVKWGLHIFALLGIWGTIIGTVLNLGDEREINKFDPFVILDVDVEASGQAIKRAYRKLSLIYHPDKNPDDPLASSRFISITKAYQALTDETSKRNWERFGNPDGPQTSKVGIGLPRILLEKDHNLLILCLFFFVLIFVVPVTFICYYQQTKNYAANGVMIETLQFLGYYITESTRLKSCPELISACAESRCMRTRPTDNADLKAFGTAVNEHKKRSFTIPVVMKNQYLTWAHMQRLHRLMSPELRQDVDELLRHSMKITQAMIEIACMREWFATAQAIIDFRRCLVQGLDVKSSQLLQIPHFTEELVEKVGSASAPGGPVTTLAEFLALEADRRKELLEKSFDGEQLLDVDAFCRHVGKVVIKAIVDVEDEPEIIVGDVAEVTVCIGRPNLQEDEAMGAVHAPLFPEPKYEEWWFFLVEATKESQTRIVHFERVTDVRRVVEQRLRFQVTKPGENKLILHAMCDGYAGLDHKVELEFVALGEEENKREFKVHHEDEDLDLQPTLFQQFMGEIGGDEESEEEEEEGGDSAASTDAPGSARREKEAGQTESGSPNKASDRSPGGGKTPRTPRTPREEVAKESKAKTPVEDEADDESSGSSSDDD